MPKETFLNLAEAKRESFLEAALHEFARNEYRAASVSRIVAKLGIAKGSVYQYFADKKDLYAYLLELAATRKQAWMVKKQGASGAAPDFFVRHRNLILASVDFDLRNPNYSLLMVNAMKESPGTEAGLIVAQTRQLALDFLRALVEEGRSKGELRDDIDELLVAQLVNAASLSVGSYMETKYGFSIVERLGKADASLPFGDKDLEKAVDDLVELLRHGIHKPADCMTPVPPGFA
ncbi:MAG: TetR/AcrR family transcriptional regulator [Spirochaetota bacterium]